MQTTGPASPDKPPALEPEAEDKVVEEGAQAKEEAVKAGDEDEEGEQEGRGGKRQRRGRRGAAGDSAVAMVKRDLLVSCLTCPLCDRLLRKATTISECLHTCESIPALPCLACSAAPPIRAGSNACVSTTVPSVSLSVARDGDWIRRSRLVLGAAPDLVARGVGAVRLGRSR